MDIQTVGSLKVQSTFLIARPSEKVMGFEVRIPEGKPFLRPPPHVVTLRTSDFILFSFIIKMGMIIILIMIIQYHRIVTKT